MPTLLEERPMTRDPEVTVRLVTEDARRGGGGGGRRYTFGGVLTTAGLGAIAVAILLVVGAITGLVDIGNPFSSTTTDTSTKVLLKQLKNLSSYNAAQGVYQVDVSQHTDVPILPNFIAGETVTFRAIGTVDTTVDFSVLATDAVQVGDDGSVSITMPPPHVGDAVVDPKQSEVINRSLGLVNRATAPFKDNPTSERELYIKGANEIEKAAHESKLIDRAKENTVRMLEGFLARLGFDRVTVTFAKSAPQSGSPANVR